MKLLRGACRLWSIALLAASLCAAAGGVASRERTGSPRAGATVLYNGAAGTAPDRQGWAYVTRGGPAARADQAGATLVDTTASTTMWAGYAASAGGFLGSTAPVPSLDRAAGYTVTFAARVEREDHSAAGADKDKDGVADRAGFSVIVLSGDKRGIELGFWEHQIWAQEDGAQEPPGGTLFTHAEGAAFSTSAAITYTLAIVGDSYRLSSGGKVILQGPLRDYSAFQAPVDPYEMPSFLFFGDNTGTSSARFWLSYIAVTAARGASREQWALYLPLLKSR